MRYDQTACLIAVAQNAAEGHSRGQHNRRNLTNERKRIDKNEEYEKIQKPTYSECAENFTAARGWLIMNLATRTN